jgi:serine/alanine adding enzyme
MRLVRSLGVEAWRSFVQEHPQGGVFHTPEMFTVFSRAKAHRPDLWAICEGKDVLAVLLPVNITLIDGLLRSLTTRAVVYGSVLCAPNTQGRAALSQLLSAYKRGVDPGVLFTELRNLSDLAELQPTLKQYGFEYKDHLNYLIDLARPAAAVLQGISRRTRKRIRQGLRNGEVAIEEAQRRAQVTLCYDLLRKSYAAAGMPLADRSLFDAAFDVLHPRGMIKFLLAYVDRQCVAGSVELLYKDCIYGWYSGVDRAYSSYVPNEMLMWCILEWGAQNGYRTYDFGGAGKPGEEYGVRDFKAKFGGDLVCYGRNTCVHAPLRLAAGRIGYGLYRRLAHLWP